MAKDPGVIMDWYIEELKNQEDIWLKRRYRLVQDVAGIGNSMNELEKQINDLFESDNGLQIFGHPVLAKVLQKFNVKKGFLLRFSPDFCKNHLPKKASIMKLETEVGKQYEVKYLTSVPGFSGGWKGFAIDMTLEEGDLAVFKLIEPKRFKVYIIRKESRNITLPAVMSLLQAQGRPCIEDGKESIVYNRTTDDQVSSKTPAIKNLFKDKKDLKELRNAMIEWAQLDYDIHIVSDLETCDLVNFLEKFSYWDNTAKLYETCYKKVRSLSHSIKRYSLAFNSVSAADTRRYIIEACCEHAEIQVSELKGIVQQLREASRMLAAELETSKAKPGWMKYKEAYCWCKDDIWENEGLIDECDNLLKLHDALIARLKLKDFDHEVEFPEKAASC